MSTDDRPDADRFGDPHEEIDEGALLFQPSGAIDPDDDDFFDPEPEPSSRSPILWVVAAVLVLGGTFGLQFLTGDDTEDAPPAVTPVAPSIPVDTTSRAALEPIPDDTVYGPIGSSVRVAVRATTRTGGPLSDTLLLFTVEDGDGSLRAQEMATSSEGIAVNFMTLPATPGPTTVTVSLPGSELEPARVVAIAQPGAPAQISIASGNRQEAEVGRLLPERTVVTVRDSEGNPVPGAVVRFRIASGDGIMAPRSRTDSLGQASALWRLGPLEGEQTLVAELSDLSPVTFSATALPSATLESGRSRPTAETPVEVAAKPFTVGGSHACAISGGSLRCWGSDERGQASPSGSLGFAAVTAGAAHTCGLTPSGVASCWGANNQGQLGDGSRDPRSTPTRVRTELRFSELTAGELHTCGLAGGGTPLCWGDNLSGQLGNGTRNRQSTPVIVGGGVAFREIAAGWSHTCGLSVSGNTYCWGQNNRGQLGDGTTTARLEPELTRTAASDLVAGSQHTCGLSGGQMVCWGGNDFGQLGDGSTSDRYEATPVSGLPGTPTQLAAGAVHTCALLADGRAFCWGQNLSGQLGDGSTTNRPTPVEVSGGLRFRSIHAGGAQTCGFTQDGAQYCWGLNLSGQLGDGTRTNRSVPTRVGG